MRPVSVSSVLAVLVMTSALADAPDPPHNTVRMTNPGGARHGAANHAAPRAQANPGEGNPALAPPNQGAANSADQTFLTQATLGGLAEVELARLAEQRANSQSVRDFARRMITDHDQTNRALRGLAESADTPLPDQLDAQNRQARDGLARLSSAEFDIEYMRLQVQGRQRMAQLLQYEIGSGADAQIKRFASDTLPTIYTHLATARQVLDQVSMRNPRIASAPPRKVTGMPTPQTPRADGTF